MRRGQFQIGGPDGYRFVREPDGWIRLLARDDGAVPVIGGKENLRVSVAAPVEWSADDDATGNNVKISDGTDLYSSAEFEADLMAGQVEDVIWALNTASRPAEGRLLEVGSGPGFLLEALAQHLPGWSLVGLDPSPVSCAQARDRGVNVVHGNLDSTDLEGPFDAVVVMGNFQLHYDPASTLAHLARLTRPGGVMFLDSKNPHTSTRTVARLLMQVPGLRAIGAANAFAAHAFHGMRHGIPKVALTKLIEDSGWTVTAMRTTSPRLLRFRNRHEFGTGLRAAVWRAFDSWDSRTDQRAWIQFAATRRSEA